MSVMVMSQEGINKPDEKVVAAEKRISDVQVFKEPLPPVATPNFKTKKVLDEDIYIRVIGLCSYQMFYSTVARDTVLSGE